MKAVRIAALFLITALVIILLIQGETLLLPLVIAICVWFIVNTIASALVRIDILGWNMPRGLAIVLSSLTIIAVIFMAIEIIVSTAETMVADAEIYQQRLQTLIANAMGLFGVKELPSFAQIVHDVDLEPIAASVGGALSNAASQLLFVFIYTIFLLAEQGSFPKKLLALSKNRRQYTQLNKTFSNINESVKTYISIKTAICLAAATLAFLVMSLFGLDYAVFWAFLIFLLNYIPTFGSMIGTLLPAVFALLQFDDPTPIVGMALLIYLLQFFLANFVEPKLMGNTLNISTMVVLLSLSLWGLIWGVAGMIFSVPITVIIIIVCAEFPSTRPVAILLSADGDVNSPKEVPGLIATGAGEATRLEEVLD